MGYPLRRALREALPPTITGMQRAIALEIADDASDDTRRSIVPLEDLARWVAAGSTEVVRKQLGRLAEAGWEFRVPVGRGRDGRVLYAVPGVRMTFRVPEFALPEGTTVPTDTPSEGTTVPSEGNHGSPFETTEGTTVPSEGTTVPSEGTTVPPYSYSPSSPQIEIPISPAAEAEQQQEAPPVGQLPAGDQFGAFWIVYPKKRAKETARKAWAAAVKRGADPTVIIAAATAYARERAQQDARYTKHPATWLNAGCYDDEPDQAPAASPDNVLPFPTNQQPARLGRAAQAAEWYAAALREDL